VARKTYQVNDVTDMKDLSIRYMGIYAMQHPLYTYALYSPKTKRVLFRQDVIFLTNVFPMREARAKGGLEPDGDNLVVYRSQKGETTASGKDLPFNDWKESDDLPLYEDHVSGFSLEGPIEDTEEDTPSRQSTWPTYQPDHTAFGEQSCIQVPVPGEIVLANKECKKDTRNENPSPVQDNMEENCSGNGGQVQSPGNSVPSEHKMDLQPDDRSRTGGFMNLLPMMTSHLLGFFHRY
jgi:hypothetical protein